jgi:hypothetical protein
MTAIDAYTSRWKPDTSFDLELVRRVAKKSDAQRAYYFSTVLATYAKDAGYDVTEYYQFHVHLKVRFFQGYFDSIGHPEKKPFYDDLNVPRNVPALFADDSEFDVGVKKLFIDWVIQRAAAVDNIYIPDANE